METIEFDINPDETNKGRVIVDGRYYGLPRDAVILFKALFATYADTCEVTGNAAER